jgi:hypothetical protein
MRLNESLIALAQIRSNGRVCHRLANVLQQYVMAVKAFNIGLGGERYGIMAEEIERQIRRFLVTGELEAPAEACEEVI